MKLYGINIKLITYGQFWAKVKLSNNLSFS